MLRLCYLAEGTEYLPAERLARAQVLQWMCFEQYNHEPNLAPSRFWLKHFDLTPERRRALADKQPLGYAALDVMEGHLGAHDYFVAGRYTVADIALYAYTHVAHEGGFDLGGLPGRARLARARARPAAARPDHARVRPLRCTSRDRVL